jgi:glyoxylase-like metal-dependent hydrolase (beta-lactamase superfamily II)
LSAGGERVEPGLHRLRLTSPVLAPVNVYVVESSRGPVLLDTGFTYSTGALVSCLAQAGWGLSDLAAVFYTHTHEDHMGGGVSLGDAITCPQYVIAGTEPARSDYYRYFESLESWPEWFERKLPRGDARQTVISLASGRPVVSFRQGGDGRLRSVVEVDEGDVVEVGDLAFSAIRAPGHDPHHVIWRELGHDRWFTGDVVLGVPTPLLQRLRDDLGTYRTTLLDLRSRPSPRLFLPGHGRPSHDFAGAVDRSLGFIRQTRAWCVDGLSRGPVDPLALMLSTFESLTPSQYQVAFVRLANIVAQLDDLVARGMAVHGEDLHWRQVAPIPSFEEELASLA